jgi:hypothetical protein
MPRLPKHEALKRRVSIYLVEDAQCAVCRRAPSSNPNHFREVASIVRALVRFFFDEEEYNRHWGGDSLEDLLFRRNPIVETESAPGIERHELNLESFILDVFESPYFDHDKGISIYAGYYEGEQNPLLMAVDKGQLPILRDAARRLLSENYFELDGYFEALITRMQAEIEALIPNGETWYRARLGTAKRFRESSLALRNRIVYEPYLGAEIGAPPPRLVVPTGKVFRTST